MTTLAAPVTCPQCDREVRISEPFAFRVDRLRSTLSCGHVVLREQIGLSA
jgi:hypothetical protein